MSYTQNRKLGNLGKCSVTSNFDSGCNLIFKKDKNKLRKKLKGQDMLLEEKKKISEFFEFLILSYTQNRKLENLGKCFVTSNFDSSCNLRFRNNKNELRQKRKGQDMLLEEKKKTSEFFEFLILSYTQNRKLGNLGKCSVTSNFDSSCNLRFRNNKNELRQTLKGQDMVLEEKKKIYEIFEFLILSYTQNRKLGNLGKCFVASNFDSSCNLRFRNE